MAALVLAVVVPALSAPPVSASPRTSRYIVTTWSPTGTDQAISNIKRTGVTPTHRFRNVLNGFAAELSSAQLAALRDDPRVRTVVPDQVVSIDAIQSSPPWGLDRVDQRRDTISGGYGYQTTGAGVTVFSIDTGVRLAHTQFSGRAVSGHDYIDDDDDANDCNGHGTHVAGSIAGSTYGVAKAAKIVAIRVLDCEGDGTVSGVVKGLEYALDHRPAGPAVVNMSLGGGSSFELDHAVEAVIDAGIPVVAAAGNDDDDACFSSPGEVPAALTVAASTKSGNRAEFSNFGDCVDLFAPGKSVRSASADSNSATEVMGGTSMAAPHVAGGVARYLQGRPSATPAQVRTALVGDSTRRALDDVQGSPNRLLYLRRNTTGAPISLSASRSDRKITLRWSPPYGFATWPVSGYQVTRSGRDVDGKTFSRTSIASSARSYTFTRLRHGTRYTMTVRAVNAAGSGSSASKVYTSAR
jgi:subtilisin family serine protease